jgi:hypothetical protein
MVALQLIFPPNYSLFNDAARSSGDRASNGWIYVSMAVQPFVDLGRFFSFLTYTQSVGLLGRGISP